MTLVSSQVFKWMETYNEFNVLGFHISSLAYIQRFHRFRSLLPFLSSVSSFVKFSYSIPEVILFVPQL